MAILDAASRSAILMDTLVTISVVDPRPAEWRDAIERAFQWFRQVEETCSRFNPESEVMGLTHQVGTAVPVSPLLFEAVRFSLEVARASNGAFDPTVGLELERRGFNRDYRTGQTIDTTIPTVAAVSWRDVELVHARPAVKLRKPLVLDLGAVVKGMAIDLASRELREATGSAIDAGGDLYLRGANPDGGSWRVGIRHPRMPGALRGTLTLTNAAVCTSGDYERAAPDSEENHIIDPRSGRSPAAVASLTAIGPTAMVADALGTAAFVLGPRKGKRFLEDNGLAGLIITPSLQERTTRGFARCYQWQRLP